MLHRQRERGFCVCVRGQVQEDAQRIQSFVVSLLPRLLITRLKKLEEIICVKHTVCTLSERRGRMIMLTLSGKGELVQIRN